MLRDGPVDILIAANVLHATRDVGVSLAHLAEAVRPGGLLILNEVTRKSAMLLCTFALLDGWWIYEDGHRRMPGTPMLNGHQWEDALRAAGFARVWRPMGAADAFAEIIVAERTTTPPSPDQPEPDGDASRRLLVKSWTPAPIRGAGSPGAGDAGSGSPVAVLAGPADRTLAGRLAERLPGAVVLDAFSPAAGSPAFPTGGRRFAAIVDLAACSGNPAQADPAGWLAWMQNEIAATRDPLLILGVTRGLEPVGPCPATDDGPGGERRAAGNRAGLYRVLQSEMSRLRSRHVDLDPGEGIDAWVDTLLAEMADPGDEPEVAYRRGERLRPVLVEAAAPASAASFAAPSFSGDEVLLITGGTRGLGLAVARHAVARWGVRRLLLTGRDVLPPRSEWRRIIETASPDGGGDIAGLAAKLRDIEALERSGAQVLALSMPFDGVSDDERIRLVLDEGRRELGPIRGVIHAAGVVDRDHLAFAGKPADALRSVLAPKTGGLDALLDALEADRPTFVVLFSSVAAAVPALAVGQCDYAMANAAMDYVAARGRGGLPLISIQWPGWSLGMGRSRPGPVYDAAGLAILSETDGLALLDRVLAGPPAAVVMPVVVAAPDRWRPAALTGRRLDVDGTRPTQAVRTPVALSQFTPVQSGPLPSAPIPSGPIASGPIASGGEAASGDRTERVADWVIGILADVLHFDRDRFSLEQAVEDYGVDSIMTVQILQTIGRSLKVEIDPSALVEHRTIGDFVRWLCDTHGAALSDVPGLAPVPPTATIPSSSSFPSSSPVPSSSPGIARTERSEAEIPGAASPGAAAPADGGLDIAVIGLSCRLPGAPTPADYWRLVSEGKKAITPVPPERWGYESGFFAGLIDDYDAFDPDYFLLSDSDVAAMDPQALLVMEEAVHACCDAGYAPADLKGRGIGVYVGARTRHAPPPGVLAQARNPVLAVGQNYLATNVSQFLDLKGPSLVVDSACSSALTAMSLAIAQLRAGDIEAAIVAGVSLLATDEGHRIFGQRGILSTRPEFHAFDRRASGFVPAEGAGVLILKPLARARADGDRIRAVIKGVAVNNDGRTAGPASPSLIQQKEVMARALAQSGLPADAVAYIETNASGSEMTDLVELKAIRDVYRAQSAAPCLLGSVKPNIGHTLCAEAVAAVIKVVLMLENRAIGPFLSGDQPLAHFDFARTPIRFARGLVPWPAGPAVAAVSSFADGGTNAHAVIAAAGDADRSGARRQPLARPVFARRRPVADGHRPPPVSASAPATTRDPDRAVPEPIAIVGMAGRYPGASTVTEFWETLCRGVDCVTEIPPSRWRVRPPADGSGRRPMSRWGGFIDGVDRFDCDFFHVSRPEADIMDPQERLFLETCWQAIEDAGYTPATLAPTGTEPVRNAVGGFVGVMHKDYTLIGAEAAGGPVPISLNQGQIANRVSFCCDFHGPSMAVDTLCSSSLTAIHLGCESLRRGESGAVIAGGVNLSLHPAKYQTYGMVNMHSSDGRCRAFGTGGDGYVSAEGVGALVLKRLGDAVRDGDHIYAVIRSAAANHIGRSSGFSVPNPVGQAVAIASALDRAGIDARSLGYVEAHGTGTMLGDPVEVEGLTRAFRRHTSDKGFCALGSVKSNVGHAEAAAGVCALTKVALQLHHRVLVPSLHADPENPLLHLAETPFRVQRSL
ncbi:MAG: KR domain-containing protein, partial [Telmatospirillum sp.]|nr:KR domain-containing protein [Telmatospirillum sp.]